MSQTTAGTRRAPVAMSRPAGQVDRGFARIREGLVHYRHTLPAAPGKLPLLMVHAGPGSGRGFEPLMVALGPGRAAIAPDTLGFGDSAVPGVAKPDIAYYADSALRLLDALGLEQVDFYGAHTGAFIGTELALRAPDRFRRLVLDGLAVWTPEERAGFLANYAPVKQPDDYGSQLLWAWQFVRDMGMFWPHYARDAAHRMATGTASAERLHASTVEVLKALSTYHLGYHAAFGYDAGARLPLLRRPVLCMARASDPLNEYLDGAAALVPNAQRVLLAVTQGVDVQARVINAFLDA